MNWINAIFYQTTWVVAVAGAGHGWWWPGPLLLLLFCTWQLVATTDRRADAYLIAAAGLLGFATDSILIQCNLLAFAAPFPWPGLAPVWIVALWMSFALTLNHSLAFLQSRPYLAALLGGIGAPAAYWTASHAWNALAFGVNPWIALGVLAAVWAIVAPLLSRAALIIREADALHTFPQLQVKH